MTELFPNVSQETRALAKFVWELATDASPVRATELMNMATKAFEDEGLEEDADFLRFYFNMQMEMMKE